MFQADGGATPHCLTMLEDLVSVSEIELRQHQSEADKTFLTHGITFTVYGDGQGTERIFLRLAAAHHHRARWHVLECGLTQPLTAINLFLKDVYHVALATHAWRLQGDDCGAQRVGSIGLRRTGAP